MRIYAVIEWNETHTYYHIVQYRAYTNLRDTKDVILSNDRYEILPLDLVVN